MSSRSLRIATIRDVDVRIAPSWLLVALALVAGYTRVFSTADRATGLALLMALVTALLFTASVLVHELAHALEGTHRGATVEGITLFLLGGATALRDGDRRAADEFAIAAVGPWSNVVLAAVLALVGHYAVWPAVAEVANLVAVLNVGLALFNLIPGAPLDGGRLLRAGVWVLTRDRHRATRVAAAFGLVLGVALVGWSMLLLVRGRPIVAPLSVGLVGAYVVHAARVEWLRGRLFGWLARRTARDLAPAAPTVQLSVDGPGVATDAVRATLTERPDTGSLTVLDADGVPVGVVRREDAEAAGEGPVPVLPLDELPRVEAGADADRLAGLLDRAQPFVVLTEDGVDAWVSSMHLIDRAIQQQRPDTP